ncbi:unnamed protein product [Cunninghamella echinulata]
MMNNNNHNVNMAPPSPAWGYPPIQAPPSIPPASMMPPSMNSPIYNQTQYLPPPMLSPYYPYAVPPPRDPFFATLSCHSEVLQCLTRSFCCCFMGNTAVSNYRHYGNDYK